MHKLNLTIYLEDSMENLSKLDLGKPIELSFNGEIWEFSMYSSYINSQSEHHTNFYTGKDFRVITGIEYSIEGSASNKSQKELRKAKEDVRKKQQEFKEAQRKLSELMENKI